VRGELAAEALAAAAAAATAAAIGAQSRARPPADDRIGADQTSARDYCATPSSVAGEKTAANLAAAHRQSGERRRKQSQNSMDRKRPT